MSQLRHGLVTWIFGILLLWGATGTAIAEPITNGSSNPLRILVWGEIDGVDAPLTDALRNMGYWAVAGTDDWLLYNDILQSFLRVDILIVRAGYAGAIPNTPGGPTYWDIWEYVAVGGGSVIIEDPGAVGAIEFFSDISSPDVAVSVASTNDAGSMTSIDQATECTAVGLISDFLPTVTNATKPVDMGNGWTTVASAGQSVGMAVASVGRGNAVYLPASLGTDEGAYRNNFLNQLLNCVGRDPAEVDGDKKILVFQPRGSFQIATTARLAGLGYDVTGSSDPLSLARKSLQAAGYNLVIIGRDQDPASPEYSEYIDDLRQFVRLDRGTVLVEAAGLPGTVALFPNDNYGDYTLEIASVGAGSTIATNNLYAQTYELASIDFPQAQETLGEEGAKWKRLLDRSGTANGVFLWGEYYSGYWAYLSGHIDDFFLSTKNSNSNEFVKRLINQCLRPYRPLEDIAYVVADASPTTLMTAMESTFPSIERSTYVDVRSSNTTMTTIGKYDAVVAFSFEDWATPDSPDGRFKDYIDRYNRGVVLCGRAFDNGTGRELVGGGFGTAYSPFNPVDDQNVQYVDYASAGDFTHNLLFGVSASNLATIHDRYRARVNSRNGAGIGVALWDNTPVALCADTAETMAFGAGLAYDGGTSKLIAPAIVLGDTSAWQFVSISPSANGGEPEASSAFVPGPSDAVPAGLAVGGGYYWYSCADTATATGTLYKLSSLVPPNNVVDSLALGYSPGDCAYDGSNIWITQIDLATATYYSPDDLAELGTLDLSAFGQSLPSGLAVSAAASGPDTMYVSGNRGDYTYQTIVAITDPASEMGSPAAIDSFPATGYEAAGLALEVPGSAPRTLWSAYPESGAPPYAGRNKICAFSPVAPGAGSGMGDGLAPERSLMMAGVNTGNNCVALNFYPGDSDNELGDGSSKTYVHKMVASALRQVSMNPRGDDPEIRLGDQPTDIQREDLLSWFVSLQNTSSEDVSVRFRIRATRPSGTDETISPYSDPAFTIGAWEKRTGKATLYVPPAITEGDWRITCYTLDSGSLIWNDKESFEVNVSGNVSFPADHSSITSPEPFDPARLARLRPDLRASQRDFARDQFSSTPNSREIREAIAAAEEAEQPILFLELDPR